MPSQPKPVSGMEKLSAEQKARVDLILAYGRLFETEDGKKVYEDMKHKFFEPLMNLTSPSAPVDPLKLAAAEGMRQAFLHFRSIRREAARLVKEMAGSKYDTKQNQAITDPSEEED